MNIEIKKSIKPVNYFDAIIELETRLKELHENSAKAVSYTHLTLPTNREV